MGLEPTTCGLRNRCSTTELRWRGASFYYHALRREESQLRMKTFFVKVRSMEISDIIIRLEGLLARIQKTRERL